MMVNWVECSALCRSENSFGSDDEYCPACGYVSIEGNDELRGARGGKMPKVTFVEDGKE